MKPKKPIRRVSKNRAKELSKYSMLSLQYLSVNQSCEVCHVEDATQIHHKRGRGIHLNDINFFLATCNHCHNYIHRNPMWARRMGYMIDRIGNE